MKRYPKLGQPLSLLSSIWAEKLLTEYGSDPTTAEAGRTTSIDVPAHQYGESLGFKLTIETFDTGRVKVWAEMERWPYCMNFTRYRKQPAFNAWRSKVRRSSPARPKIKRIAEHAILEAFAECLRRAYIHQLMGLCNELVRHHKWFGPVARAYGRANSLSSNFNDMTQAQAEQWLSYFLRVNDRLTAQRLALFTTKLLPSASGRIRVGGEPYTKEEMALIDQKLAEVDLADYFHCKRCQRYVSFADSEANMVAQSAGGGAVCDDCKDEAYVWTGPEEDQLVPKPK